jgi:hypothetical protein
MPTREAVILVMGFAELFYLSVYFSVSFMSIEVKFLELVLLEASVFWLSISCCGIWKCEMDLIS